MTKAELIILRELNEIDDLKKRIEELESVLLEIEAIIYRNDVEWGSDDYEFIMKEINRIKE